MPISPPPNGCGSTHTPAGRGADTLPGAKRLFLPMRTGRGTVGIVGLDSDQPGATALARSAPPARCAGRSGGARHRAHQSGRRYRPRAPRRGNRTAALGAAHLDHPRSAHAAGLDSGLGDAASRSYRDTLDDAAQEELIGTIQEEAERLNRFIANLLDMTRLESGAIEPQLELVDLADVVGSALRRAGKVLAQPQGRTRSCAGSAAC